MSENQPPKKSLADQWKVDPVAVKQEVVAATAGVDEITNPSEVHSEIWQAQTFEKIMEVITKYSIPMPDMSQSTEVDAEDSEETTPPPAKSETDHQTNRANIERSLGNFAVGMADYLRESAFGNNATLPTPINAAELKQDYESSGGTWSDQFIRLAKFAELTPDKTAKFIKILKDVVKKIEIPQEFTERREQLEKQADVAHGSALQTIDNLISTIATGETTEIFMDGRTRKVRLTMTTAAERKANPARYKKFDEDVAEEIKYSYITSRELDRQTRVMNGSEKVGEFTEPDGLITAYGGDYLQKASEVMGESADLGNSEFTKTMKKKLVELGKTDLGNGVNYFSADKLPESKRVIYGGASKISDDELPLWRGIDFNGGFDGTPMPVNNLLAATLYGGYGSEKPNEEEDDKDDDDADLTLDSGEVDDKPSIDILSDNYKKVGEVFRNPENVKMSQELVDRILREVSYDNKNNKERAAVLLSSDGGKTITDIYMDDSLVDMDTENSANVNIRNASDYAVRRDLEIVGQVHSHPDGNFFKLSAARDDADVLSRYPNDTIISVGGDGGDVGTAVTFIEGQNNAGRKVNYFYMPIVMRPKAGAPAEMVFYLVKKDYDDPYSQIEIEKLENFIRE
ncbi:MAG: hypothetical protein LBM09_01130 [Candidatus Nomurabacteria bacterium]|jgi:proteasome lid subunit RPN8/RPN11|nr:hypothetical protein [Candidatus Nomurabacteria bacterium]